jgi:sulfonate transport system permease protein
MNTLVRQRLIRSLFALSRRSGLGRGQLAKFVAQLPEHLLPLLLPLLLLGLWQLATAQAWLPPQILPAPALVAQTFVELGQGGELLDNLAISLQRILWSTLIGGGTGLLLGVAMGLSPRVKAYLYPSFELVAQFPVVGWIPLLIVFLGIDEALKIAAVSLAVVLPVVLGTLRGIQNQPATLLEVGAVYGFTPLQRCFRIALPAALPDIFTGLRQGVMQAWLSLVFVELLASSEGIGYLMVWGRQLMQLDIVFVGILVIGAVGFAMDKLLGYLEANLNARLGGQVGGGT